MPRSWESEAMPRAYSRTAATRFLVTLPDEILEHVEHYLARISGTDEPIYGARNELIVSLITAWVDQQHRNFGEEKTA